MKNSNNKEQGNIISSQEVIKTMIEDSTDCIYITDLHGNIIDYNRATERLMGYHKGELLGKNCLKEGIILRKDLKKVIKDVINIGLSGSAENWTPTLKKKDGKRIRIEATLTPFKLNGEHHLLGIARDITKKKEEEDALINRTRELEKENKFMIGRELKMVQLKNRIKMLKHKLIYMKKMVLRQKDISLRGKVC
jgi:PAS domain S-box-containing protein